MIGRRIRLGVIVLLWIVVLSSSSLYPFDTVDGDHQFLSKVDVDETPRHSAILILDTDLAGKIIIHDLDDLLVVELTKALGREVVLGLDEGEYRLTNIVGGDVYNSEIILKIGKSVKLKPDDLEKVDLVDDTSEEPPASMRKNVLLGDKIKTHFFGGIESKSTSIDDEYALLMGGRIGLTFNRSFSIGIAGYGRIIRENGAFDLSIDHDPGQPAYGGVTFGYTFFPEKMVHLKAGALFGAGNYFCRDFLIFEPEIDLVLNVSRIVRARCGISLPFTDRDDVGLDNLIFNVGFQFGK